MTMSFSAQSRSSVLQGFLIRGGGASDRRQIDDLVAEVNKEIEKKNKVLITTLTKRMAEDLTDYMKDLGIRVRYLHSDIDTLERAEIIRDMRLDVFDVLVGINLLREGLDIPEITLVAILDADKEGFLVRKHPWYRLSAVLPGTAKAM